MVGIVLLASISNNHTTTRMHIKVEWTTRKSKGIWRWRYILFQSMPGSSPLVLNNYPAVGSGLGSTPGEYRSATRLYLLCSRIPTRTMHTNTLESTISAT